MNAASTGGPCSPALAGPDRNAGPTERRLRVCLAAALLLLFLAVWKGDPHRGTLDMAEYFWNSEALWLRGDMSFVDEQGRGPLYHRYPVGLAVLSGPFVLAGHVLDAWTHGLIKQRAVIALVIPLLTVGSVLLIYSLGRALECSARVSLWAALLFALGSPVLTFVRIYYCDMAVVCFALFAVWSALGMIREPARACAWAALTGAGLAGMTSCHYAASVMSIALGVSFAAAVLRLRQKAESARAPVAGASRACTGPGETPLLRHGRDAPATAAVLAALCAAPVAVAAALMVLNYSRYGHVFATGYDIHYPGGSLLTTKVLDKNASTLAMFCWRTPWIALGLWGLLLGARRAADKAFFAGALFALAGQAAFWLFFRDTWLFPVRYLLPLLSLLAVGLLLAGQGISCRWPRRGLFYVGLVCVCWNLFYFLRGEDPWPSFFIDPRHGPEVRCHVWYMSPLAPDQALHWGTPMGWPQTAILVALLTAGAALLTLAYRAARSLDGLAVAPNSQ